MKIKSNVAPVHAFISLYLFLFLPFFLYRNSSHYWNYNFSDFIKILLPLSCITYLLLFSTSLWIKPAWQKRYLALMTGIGFSLWASEWFVGHEGVQDGTTFEVLTDKTLYLTNFLVLFLVGIGFGLIGYYKPRITNVIFVMTCILNSIILLFGTLANSKASFLNHHQSEMELSTFSKDQNVLVLMLDSFQSDLFQEIMATHPEWAKEFTGFTYFSDAQSTASGTLLSIPTIHSGVAYQPKENVHAFYQKNVVESSFMKELKDNHYRTMILNPYFGYSPKGAVRVSQYYLSCPRFGALCEVVQLIHYALYNAVPHALKKYVYNEGGWMLSQFFPQSGVLSHQILSSLASDMNTHSKEPTAKFLHLYNVHAPAVLNEKCEVKEHLVWNRTSGQAQATCAISQVVKVLKALKQHGIYDKTALFITADHGSGFTKQLGDNRLSTAANPLLLVKSFQQTGALKTLDNRVSLMDVKSMVCEATHDCDLKNDSKSSNLSQNIPFFYVKNEKLDSFKFYSYELSDSPRNKHAMHRVLTDEKIVHHLPFLGEGFLDYSGIGWISICDESNQRWTYGEEAQLVLPLSQEKDAILSFYATTHPENSDETMSIWANGHFVTELYIPMNEYYRFQVKIPKEIITAKPTQIQLKFSKSNPLLTDENKMPYAVAFSGVLEIG